MMPKKSSDQPSSTPRPTPVASTSMSAPMPGMKVVESTDLFGRLTEIGIMHDGSLYRLKITRQGKLILNK
jgi:hemin uptake protein HemP